MLQLGRILLVSALMVSIGAQWAVLQSAAWIGMAVTYSLKEGSLTEGLSKTFDGEHPCPLCCAIKKGQDKEKKDPRKLESKKLKHELIAGETPVIVIARPKGESQSIRADQVAVSRMASPAVPPPRAI